MRKASQDRRLGAVEFLVKHYSGFLDGTVTRADIKAFDTELYQGLTNWLRTNDMPPNLNLPTARSAPDRDAVIMSAKKSGQLKSDFEQSSGFDMEAFKAHAAAHQWKTRRERGYNWNADVFEYVRDTYGSLIEAARKAGSPLTQADFKIVDSNLWMRIQQVKKTQEMPEWLDVPTAKDASLRGLSEEELEKVLAARQSMRETEKLRREAGLR